MDSNGSNILNNENGNISNVKKNSNQALVLQMGKQGDGLKANGMVSKSTTNDLDNFNSKKKQSLVSKKIALPVNEKYVCVLFDFATMVEIIQIIITCKGLREFSIQSHDQNDKKKQKQNKN